MLSHLMGAANRADIRRLRELEAENAALQAKVERQQRQLRDATIRELTRALETRIDAEQDRLAELGGHAPVIVCDDADPEASAATSALGKSRNSGQVCISPTRFFVREAADNRFTTTFGETPFGGAKDSGYGREGRTEGLECYTITKNVPHLVGGASV